MTGQDWAGRQFTTFPELLGVTEEGKYRGQTVRWAQGRAQALEPVQIPSWLAYEARQMTPVQVQSFLGWLAGEYDGFDAIARGLGVYMRSKRFKEKGGALIPKPPKESGLRQRRKARPRERRNPLVRERRAE